MVNPFSKLRIVTKLIPELVETSALNHLVVSSSTRRSNPLSTNHAIIPSNRPRMVPAPIIIPVAI